MSVDKTQNFKLGEMTIDNKQVFWKMQHCFALIPIVQLLDGHILIASKRKVLEYSELQPVQIFDIGLTIRFISKSMESFHGLNSTTIHIQNASSESPIKQMMIHIIPRKANDLKSNDAIYSMLSKYPEELITHYNEKMNFYINAYVNKILEGIHEQSKKYESHLNICFKEEKEA